MIGEVDQCQQPHDAERDRDQDHRRAALATEESVRLRGVSSVVRYEQPGERVDEQPDATEDREGGEQDAKDDRVNAGVTAETAADAADHPIVAAAA
jgi:hypothetical protein